MSKDDSSGGFLSKVVKFVRHPTTSWSDLDSRSADRESEYSKAALKEMIERKRRNDFVRKREFDMLRKIRSREASSGSEGAGVRPSFFQSSLPSKPDDRALTLKKIDEIEAQMSMQWWKTKGPDSLVSTGSGLHSTGGTPLDRKQASSKEDLGQAREDARRQQQYKETEPARLGTEASEAASVGDVPMSAEDRREWSPSKERELAPVAESKPRPSKARTGLMAPAAGAGPVAAYSDSGASSSFSASHFFAMDVQEIAQDPEVEEAAIRFANGDDTGAEQGLLECLTEQGGRVNDIEDWLALFDLYRATGQVDAFESRAVDFVNRFDRSAPQWYDMPAMVVQLAGKKFKPSAQHGRAVWAADSELDAHAVGTLQNVLLRSEQPWVLDWSSIESIDLKAARALLGIFTLWSDQEVDLRWFGTHQLRELLKSLTPSGRRDVEQIWWELRMTLLRLMNRPDEFELTALDFCVTYEVSPPGWERPRCHFQALAADGGEETGQSVLGEGVLEPVSVPGESVMDSQGLNQLGLVELSGEIRGDPQETLDGLEKRLLGADVMIISCRNLIRVDFSAAGTLLNWVSAHHAEGRLVQFVDVHRLVSAFFHVIGITEHAKVVLRND
ncbi:MAG TPA: STAS domain-containing protein [Hydrogenophaga sp.]|uniref:STAS domain-containing protein n=1 Tax=Hydrogenophaga sp. TaxID=1904254 RepID=UPI002C6C3F2D|nr:STAS domain-containing protein [Hydrogenophaga sp.]HMN93507.1 STAS domain-containing protein [Hydrogenophaga sp.]HMP09622.1 STAS domain-containing protein [Hydrogenophaga sp.]